MIVTGFSPGFSFDSAGWYHASDCSMLAMMFLCVRVAPFDTPVVPPVYCRNATSLWPTSTGFRFIFRPSAIISLQRTAFGSEYSGNHLLDVAHDEVDEQPLEEAEHVAHGAHHRDLGRHLVGDLLEHVREVLEDEDRLGARSP